MQNPEPAAAAAMGLDGSVVRVPKRLSLECHDNQSNTWVTPVHVLACDECEQRRAQVTCADCGLVYCTLCDAHRHRKGKLQGHLRLPLDQKTIKAPAREAGDDRTDHAVAMWKLCDVCDWLEAHDLEVFVVEAQRQQLTGTKLLALDGLEQFLDGTRGVSRGHKKKLQREVYKLQSLTRSVPFEDTTSREPAPSPPMDSAKKVGRHFQLDLHVDVESVARKLPPQRRAPGLNLLGLGPLRIDVDKDDREAMAAPKQSRRERHALRALALDIAQVQKEEKTVAASFDFSATGRLQTQGFEINTRGIANVPFAGPQQYQAHEKKSLSTAHTVSTKDYLLLLEELGQGAGGKVYKALYMPTFILVAVKVIRVYDQKKRHQMVRELKSLYVNYVPLATATFPSSSAATSSAARAACKELVIFYDAYTNPEVGSVSIVLEYMDGGSLEDYVKSVTEGDGDKAGCLSEKEIANVAACGLKGLAFLHEHHQLHRDIKLSNMLINHQGHVKISDFGISRDLESTLAKATTFTGTLLYMAPERISGGMYSYPSDLWSFGLAVMACAIGKLPVPTKDGYWGVVHAVQEQPSPRLRDYGDHFSSDLCDLLDQCLHKNPLYRPPASDLLEHPFIKKNYTSREQAHVRLSRDRPPLTTKALERSRQEMKSIAEKAQNWCRDHADAFRQLSHMSEVGEARDTSSWSKIEVLAKQLRLPVDEVASHFTFLDEYCKCKPVRCEEEQVEMESNPMPSSLAVLTSPRYRTSDAGNALDGKAFTSLSAANFQVMASQSGIEQLLSLAHHHVDNAMAAQYINDMHEAPVADGKGDTTAKKKTIVATTLSRIVSKATRTLHWNARGEVGSSPDFMTLAVAEVGEARYKRLRAGFTKLKDHVNDVSDHREQLLRSLDQLQADTISLQETFLCMINSSASSSAEPLSSFSASCAAIEDMKTVLEQKVAKQTSRKLTELQLFEQKLHVREKLRCEVAVAEKQLQTMRTKLLKRGHRCNHRKHAVTMHEVEAKRQEFQLRRRRLAVMTEALEHVFQFHFQLDQCIAEPELETVRSHLQPFFQHNQRAFNVLSLKL